MAKYLSEDWGRAVEKALNEDPAFQEATKGVDLTLQQVVNDVPDLGEVKYYYIFKDGSVSYNPGETANPDAKLTQNYETASALNSGELNSQQAFVQGKVKMTGNLGKVLKNQGALQTMVPVLNAVPTEY